MTNQEKIEFWNNRAANTKNPGTDDYNLKKLEEQIIIDLIPHNANILDIGCGDGSTLIKLVLEKNCIGVGVDFSEKMIDSAKTSMDEKILSNKIRFIVDSIPNLKQNPGTFDYIISERCLINLESEKLQHQAFLELMSYLKTGGFFLLIESFTDGLDNVNDLRQKLRLEPINPPWHNLFLNEKSIEKWQSEKYHIEKTIHFSSSYYFVSRVIYAKLAQNAGEILKYDSEINQIACELPPIGEFGPTRLVLWKKLND